MAKFIVKMPIEIDGKLYMPAGSRVGLTSRSRGNGGAIPVDASGLITLTEEQAAQMISGQIEAAAETAVPEAAREKPPKKTKEGKPDGD